MGKLQPRTQWKYLESNPQSSYRQLFIKGRRIRARVLYGLFMSNEEPMTVEEIARDFELPVEAVEEAIAYCQSNPPEIERDFRRDEAMMQATGMMDPGYKLNPHPKPVTPEEMAEIERRFE